jgi:putative SOS response-associated peptidase YedK
VYGARSGMPLKRQAGTEKENVPAFAGLYEFWPDPSLPVDDPNRWLLSCTVLTTTAHDSLGHVHDRSPVIIPPSMYARWLDPDTTDKVEVQEMLDAIGNEDGQVKE